MGRDQFPPVRYDRHPDSCFQGFAGAAAGQRFIQRLGLPCRLELRAHPQPKTERLDRMKVDIVVTTFIRPRRFAG